ncbi:hypothetical protein D3C80_1652610 [compost metagenome]
MPPLMKVIATVKTFTILVAVALVWLNMQARIESIIEAIIISRQNSISSHGRLPQYTPNSTSVKIIIAAHCTPVRRPTPSILPMNSSEPLTGIELIRWRVWLSFSLKRELVTVIPL